MPESSLPKTYPLIPSYRVLTFFNCAKIQKIFTQTRKKTTAHLNISHLPAGTYITHINTASGKTERKFVVRK
ncbi:MAG: T9SS type A sorting domain-containing protein [Bacteroidales bacterium]|nr:T9SS type A sorting domain-containing protein [Bacteroidales bacterium]